MNVPSLKQKKGWRKAPSHIAAVASTAKAQHYRYSAVASLSLPHCPAVPVNTHTYTENGSQIKSLLEDCLVSPRLLWKPELRSCLPHTLSQKASPSPGSTFWTCTVYQPMQLFFPKRATFQLPVYGLPWLLKHTGRGNWGTLPQLSSPLRHSPAVLLPMPAPGTSPETTFSKTVSNFSTAVSQTQLKFKIFINCMKSLKYRFVTVNMKLLAERTKIFPRPNAELI